MLSLSLPLSLLAFEDVNIQALLADVRRFYFTALHRGLGLSSRGPASLLRSIATGCFR